jgi:hypothetical protein
MVYIPSFIKIGSDIQKLIEDTQTHRRHDELIRLFHFLLNNESRLLTKRVFLGKHGCMNLYSSIRYICASPLEVTRFES